MPVIVIAFIGMGRGDDVFDAVRHCHAAHFLGHVPGFRAIIDVGKNVAVDINHGVNFQSKALIEFKQIPTERPRGELGAEKSM